ncbi:radical SAM protein [Desulfosarcina ovata]|uniref:Radical SAM protein n=1 Tax=Desulfosarcina ovata subsp. ovata TaxID=2752305 RepID=A0A5K8A9K4_9BACT|nr:radical SAM protein [Desulfosarcina ovata]BBO89181.1 radical SAM protein [Desulfosarcina ovata subsp. ovata]
MSFLHPCFDHKAHYEVPRFHLPVAFRCNAACRYCGTNTDREFIPGASNRVMCPEEAVDSLAAIHHLANDAQGVVGISGPKEPLANPETIETLTLVREKYPHVLRCLCTNGVNLPIYAKTVRHLADSVTVTVNAVSPESWEKIYKHIVYKEKVLTGRAGFERHINNQIAGIKILSPFAKVKINTVLVPGVNEMEIKEIGSLGKRYGAVIHNIMPLIPLNGYGRFPTQMELQNARDRTPLPTFLLCKQCRADACGIPGNQESAAELYRKNLG